MTRAELIEKYSGLLRHTVPGTMVPAGGLYQQFCAELGQLTGDGAVISYDTHQAAPLLGVKSKTLTNWLNADVSLPRSGRRFPNARKTGRKGGKWVIPAPDIQAYTREAA